MTNTLDLLLQSREGYESTNLAKRWRELEECWTINLIKDLLSLRSSGATKYSGMLRFGCMAMRSDIRRRPECMEVVLSTSKAATMAFPFEPRTSINSIVLFVASSN